MECKGIDRGAGNSPEGRYANYFEIGHNACEFIVDFGQSYFEEPESRTTMHSRIIISPFYAGMLLDVLQKAVNQHGQRFGRFVAEEPESDKAPAMTRESGGGQVLKIIHKNR